MREIRASDSVRDKETDKKVVRTREIRFHRNRNKETGRWARVK